MCKQRAPVYSQISTQRNPPPAFFLCVPGLNVLDYWPLPDIPLGSTPATGAAVLGSPTASDLHDLNHTPNEPELPAVISTPFTCVRNHC